MRKDRPKTLLAYNLKRLRAQLELTADELAEKADLSGGYIRQLETLHTWVSSKTLDALARALRVPIHELFLERRK